MSDYLTEFESLENRIVGVPPSFLLECFISVLKPPIQREVLALRPVSLTDATELAKFQEERFNESRQACFCSPAQPPPPLSGPTLTPSSLGLTSSPLLFKRLTAPERQIRREKGLCYNCEENFGPPHRCKSRFLLLLAEDDDDFSGEASNFSFVTADDNPPVEEADSGRLSLNAFMGQYNPQTFQVTAQLAGRSIQILVDSGSSHNFLQARLAKQLGLST